MTRRARPMECVEIRFDQIANNHRNSHVRHRPTLRIRTLGLSRIDARECRRGRLWPPGRLWAVAVSTGRLGAVRGRPSWTDAQRERPDYQQLKALIKGAITAADESACTPGSVPVTPRRDRRRPSISACRCRQAPAAYPQTRTGHPQTSAQAPTSRRWPFWPCSGWGLPSHPGHPGCWWALTPPFHPYRPGRGRGGGLFSVALSRGSPRVAVSNHPALRSPDVPRR
jgi:hypothetical protein